MTVKVVFNPPTFSNQTYPRGWLNEDMACQALWYYYIHARKAYEESVETIVLEGTVQREPHFRQLYTTTATLYGVSPERMQKFWANVDKECERLELPSLPMGYRMDGVQEVRTQ